MRDLRLLCPSLYAGACLRRVQLWFLPGSLCYMRRSWYIRCVLLQGVHPAGERSRWLSKDCQFRQCED
ncbi:hypothetical protein LINPERPRIM_LOCUS18003 [Linum perenne]